MDEQLDAVFQPEAAPIPEPVVEAPVEEVTEPVAEPAPDPVPEPVEAPKEQHAIPIATALQWRDEAKEYKRQLEAQRQEQPAQRPDPFDDPDGFAQHIESRVAQAEMQAVWKVSDRLARKEHGPEVVDAAVAWATEKAPNDPGFAASYMRAEDPIDWIVQQHKRDSLVSQLPTDVSSIEELIEREIAKRGLSAPVAAAPIPVAASVQQAPKPAAPPRSLVDAPSSGGVTHTPIGTAAGLEAVFPK